jgi:hypothetical protein
MANDEEHSFKLPRTNASLFALKRVWYAVFVGFAVVAIGCSSTKAVPTLPPPEYEPPDAVPSASTAEAPSAVPIASSTPTETSDIADASTPTPTSTQASEVGRLRSATDATTTTAVGNNSTQ